MSDPPKIRKFIFHIRKKSVFLASGLSWLCLKPSLRSGFKAKPFEPRKILFLSHEKWIYCFWSVFYKKNTIYHIARQALRKFEGLSRVKNQCQSLGIKIGLGS